MSDGGHLNTIILAVTALVTAITPIMLAYINRERKQDAKAAAQKVESVRTDLQDQAVTANKQLDAIHVAVNSERAAMLAKLEALHEEIRRLTAIKAEAEGEQAGRAQGIAEQKTASRTAFRPERDKSEPSP
jgi:hypothetical protein